jgi:hypothetical protein
MKAISFLTAYFLVATTLKAQTLNWAKSFGGSSSDVVNSITLDASGNVYTTGDFRSTVDFDPGAGAANYTSVGSNDIFVQKLDASGNFIWAKSFGGSSDDVGNSIIVDVSGNVYTTGYFRNTVDFDPGVGTANLTSVGSDDIFVQKLDASGNFIWAKSFGNSSVDQGNSINVDASGNVYTTGYFRGTADFDPGANIANFTSVGDDDIFVQKLDVSGNFIWAKSFGTSSRDRGISITKDASGNVYTTGFFGNTVDFDPGAGTANLTSVGGYDIFLQKLDASGNFIWAKSFGGSSNDYGSSSTIDASGNVYTTGQFPETADLAPGAGTANFTSVGGLDIFVQKLDSSGNFIWAKSFGSSSDDWGNSITLDASGNVYTTGFFLETADFDPGSDTANFTSAGGWDIFVQKMSQCSPTTSTDIHTACDLYTWINGNTYTASNNTATWTLINAAGCDSVVTLNLTINSVSDINTSSDGLTLTAINSNATYQWLYCDNNYGMINDETNQTFTATTSGNFAVELTENGCVDTSSCVEITTVGILENTFSPKIKVFPNPTSGKVLVAFDETFNNAEITLTDLKGKIVFTKQLDVTKEALLEIEESAGVYFLTIKTPNELSVVKLVKE